MAGEMFYADPQEWPLHAAIAEQLGGELEPFDVYQGPYVAFGPNLRAGDSPYSVPLSVPGAVRLWVTCEDGYWCSIYREDTEESSGIFPYDDEESAVLAARMLLRREW